MKTSAVSQLLWIAILLPVIFSSCNSPKATTQRATDLLAENEDTDQSISESDAARLIELQTSVFAEADFAIANAMAELPDWMSVEDIPFETDAYFQTDQKQNGGQNYLRAVACSSLKDVLVCIPGLNREDVYLTEEQRELLRLNDKFSDVRYRLLDRLYEPDDADDAEYFKNNLEQYLKRVEPVIAELRKAQKYRSSVIHRNFALDAYGPFAGFRNAAQDLCLLCKISDFEKAVEAIGVTMDLGRVLRAFGSGTEQITSVAILRFAINDQLKPLMEKTNDPKQLERIIEVLHRAHLSEREIPRYLEHAKFEHFQLRQLLHELQTDTLDYDVEHYEYFGVGEDDPTVLKAHKLMTTDFIGGYVSNEEIAIELLQGVAATNEQLEEAKQLIEESRQSPLSQDAAAGMILPVVMASVDTMNADDFQEEVEILKHRYKDVEKCTKLPFPDQINAIAVLQKQWTNDKRWNQTRFLKWYRPHQSFGKFFVKARLLVDGYLSLACVKKFQLENDGRLPRDVEEALSSAGIQNPEHVIDPYSGKSLQILKSEAKQLALYSVGPDRKDDRGETRLPIDAYASEDGGDVVLSLQ